MKILQENVFFNCRIVPKAVELAVQTHSNHETKIPVPFKKLTECDESGKASIKDIAEKAEIVEKADSLPKSEAKKEVIFILFYLNFFKILIICTNINHQNIFFSSLYSK